MSGLAESIAMAGEHRHTFTIDVTDAVPELGEPAHIGVELVLPAEGPAPGWLLVCLPGGGMNRRYFDLPTPPGEAEASFASALAAKGFAVALVDFLGVGTSSLPADPYLLTPYLLARANGHAARALRDGLVTGTIGDIAPIPGLRAIGVGHSFGAGLTVVQQAADPLYEAVALFGFGIAGLPDSMPAEVLALDIAEARARFAQITRDKFDTPFMFIEAPPSKRAVSAASAGDRLLSTAMISAMLPNHMAPDAAAITVPVLIASGDGDLHGDPHRLPAIYSGSSDVTLIVLRETRHNHFVYPTRTALFDRVARWASAL